MNGTDPINVTLSLPTWREVYRILQNDHGWKSHLSEIEKRCQRNQTTIQFQLAMTWPMSATVRLSSPELADEISRQMSAQCFTPKSSDGSF